RGSSHPGPPAPAGAHRRGDPRRARRPLPGPGAHHPRDPPAWRRQSARRDHPHASSPPAPGRGGPDRSSTTQPDTCQHVRDVRTLTRLGLTHRTATGTAGALQEIAETKLACQKSCGPDSPYRGQDINPHAYAAPTREDPVADTLIELGRAA